MLCDIEDCKSAEQGEFADKITSNETSVFVDSSSDVQGKAEYDEVFSQISSEVEPSRVNEVTPYIEFTCDICGEKNRSRLAMKQHVRLHGLGGKNKNKQVNVGLPKQSDLNAHIRKAHKRTRISKKQFACDARFTSRTLLTIHKIIPTEKSAYACDVCDSRFSTNGNLTRHKRLHTGDKPYACYVCEARFTSRTSLTTHNRIHTGEKPFACDVCEARFYTNSHLTLHIRTHTGEKPYGCDVCEVRFCTSSNLTKHKRTHTGEKPYACDVCELRFSTNSNLTEHKRTHTGEKPYACDVCAARFKTRNHLAIHRRRHTGEKPYACDEGEARFARCNYLNKHSTLSSSGSGRQCFQTVSGMSSGEDNYTLEPSERAIKSARNRISVLVANSSQVQSYDDTKDQTLSHFYVQAEPSCLNQVKDSIGYACDTCGVKLSSRSSLKQHVRLHGPNGKRKYKQFDVQCAKQSDINDYGKIYDTMDQSADNQGQRLNINSSLSIQEQPKTIANPYACSMCKVTFCKRSHLVRHKHSHTDEVENIAKPYACDKCKETFCKPLHLIRHKRSHMDEEKNIAKPYACDMCTARFCKRSHLTRHKLSHTGEKPFACDTCKGRFVRMYDLKVHKRIHTGEKPFACEICEARFNTTSGLNIHKRSHTGEKPFACDECGALYSSSSHLTRHKRLHAKKRHKCS